MDYPICGTLTRLNWLKGELFKDLAKCSNETEKQNAFAWYLSYGVKLGLSKKMLLESFESDDSLYKRLSLITEI